MNEPLDVRKYTLEDQRRFAALSGDFNPVHVDPLAARRELYGEIVVHGVHGLLHALDAWLHGLREEGAAGVILSRLSGRFPNPILLGQPVETRIVEPGDGCVKLQARHGHRSVLEVTVHYATIRAAPSARSLATAPVQPETAARDLALAEIDGRGGALPLYAAPGPLADVFPHAAALLSAATVGELLAMTRLVGMECPGLHSIFSSFDVEFHPPESAGGGSEFRWRVEYTDERISLVRLALEGPTLHGHIDAFRRPEPQVQPGINEVCKQVSRHEFAGQTALVVGGSRGLGEVTAKIIAAGGGHPIITYYRGREEARKLAAEIQYAGLACDVVACDVAAPDDAIAELAETGLAPTHIYYFATPKIFVSKAAFWEPEIFRTFSASYVDHFHALVRALHDRFEGPISVFYPSSTVLNERVKTLAEYSVAKAAGEELCAYLDRFECDVHVHVRRLPRIATDQTLTLTPYPAANALDVMLEIARELATD